MATEKTQVLIELALEMKKAKGQFSEIKDALDELSKQIRNLSKVAGKSLGSQKRAFKDVGTASKEAAKEAAKAEREKAKAVKQTNDAIEEQQKKLGKLAKAAQALGKVPGIGQAGRFAGGFGAGMGLAGLRRPITARGVGGALGRGVAGGIMGLANFAVSGFSNAYQKYMEVGQARGGLVGLGTPGELRAGYRAGGRVGGAGLGFNAAQTAMQARGVGRATGNIGAVYRAQQFGRATGMDVGEAGAFMGVLRGAGFGFGGRVRQAGGGERQLKREGTRELTKIMEAGMTSGIEKARIPEFIQGVGGVTQQLGGRLAGRANVSGVAAFMSMLGRSGQAGFQGNRGAAVASQLNQAIQRPGGGEAGQAMMLQALGFGKPGGGTSYYDALKKQQQGINDPTNVMKMFTEVNRQLGKTGIGGKTGASQEANLALSEMTGLSLRQVEGLQEILNSDKDSAEKLKSIKEQLKKAEPIEKQALKEMKSGFGGVVTHMSNIYDRQAAVGNKVSKIFMTIQNLQVRALEALAEWLPKIGEGIKHIYGLMTGWFRQSMKGLFGDNEKYEKFIKKQREYIDSFGIMNELRMKKMSAADILKSSRAKQQAHADSATGAVRARNKEGIFAWGTQDRYMRFAESQARAKREEKERRSRMKEALSEMQFASGTKTVGPEVARALSMSAQGHPMAGKAIERARESVLSKDKSVRGGGDVPSTMTIMMSPTTIREAVGAANGRSKPAYKAKLRGKTGRKNR
jgi:hypothetical protein